jgi:hypothetical protein
MLVTAMDVFYTVEFYVNGSPAAYPRRYGASELCQAYDTQDNLRDHGQHDAVVIAYPGTF